MQVSQCNRDFVPTTDPQGLSRLSYRTCGILAAFGTLGYFGGNYLQIGSPNLRDHTARAFCALHVRNISPAFVFRFTTERGH
jgi:hypothetical protein